MSDLKESLESIVSSHVESSFAIVERLLMDPDDEDGEAIRDLEERWLRDLDGMSVVGSIRSGDGYEVVKDFHLVDLSLGYGADLSDGCDVRSAGRDVGAVLDHTEAHGLGGFLYHRSGEDLLWWVEDGEPARSFVRERFDALAEFLREHQGWEIDRLLVEGA